jgi:hypothetical protein
VIAPGRAKSGTMLLNFLPDMPDRKNDHPYKFLGYWHAVSIDIGTNLPLPLRPDTEWRQGRFARYEETCGAGVLPLPCDYIDNAWDPAERDKIVTYLKTGETFESWRGNSGCRFRGCGVRYLAGYRDFTDWVYVWPEAFHHYVEVHGVKPPQEFIDHVLQKVSL